jgi:hypothetical protein
LKERIKSFGSQIFDRMARIVKGFLEKPLLVTNTLNKDRGEFCSTFKGYFFTKKIWGSSYFN